MNAEPEPTITATEVPVSRDAANWAKPSGVLHTGDVDKAAINLNVEGRAVLNPNMGFGKMWQKTYKTYVADVPPEHVIAQWKAHFPEYWPSGSKFFGPLAGLAPGDVAVLNLRMPGKVRLSTGVLVIYADDVSFSFLTPQGHMFAGMITFSAEQGADSTVVQAQVLLRAGDPVYELGMTFGGHRQEDKFWQQTMQNLAAHLGTPNAVVDVTRVCVDKKRQWRNWTNIRYNAALRTMTYLMTAPARVLARPFRRRKAADDG